MDGSHATKEPKQVVSIFAVCGMRSGVSASLATITQMRLKQIGWYHGGM